jgi:molybdopterin synthase catalytic subunit
MYLKEHPLDVAEMLASSRRSDGGICVFLGVVRNENAGRPTEKIEYQAYDAMAESEIGRIAQGLAREWPDAQVAIRHRVGVLFVGEIAVAVVASAPHRAEAFAACRAAIDRIKTTVPIWKREFHPDGSTEWVDPTRKDVGRRT